MNQQLIEALKSKEDKMIGDQTLFTSASRIIFS